MMGISKGYNHKTGRWVLDCDKCGDLGANRVKCPINYCYPVQLCAKCAKETNWRKKEMHAKCYENSIVDSLSPTICTTISNTCTAVRTRDVNKGFIKNHQRLCR